MVYWTDQFSGTPEADGDEMLNEQWMSIGELRSKLLYPPFESSLDMLENYLKKYLTHSHSIDTITSEDGGSGSGNFGHGGRPGKIGGSSGGTGQKADFNAAKEYTKAVRGIVAANGVVVKNVSGHAGYRMKQRKISIDDLVKDLKEPSATYPGNKKNKDATCFQRGNDRIVLSKDGVVITTIDLEDD